MKLVMVLILGLSLCLLDGCARTRITTSQPAYGLPVENTSHHFLWEIVGDGVEASGQISRVEVYKGFGDYVLSILTLGIYTPWSVKVWYSETHSK